MNWWTQLLIIDFRLEKSNYIFLRMIGLVDWMKRTLLSMDLAVKNALALSIRTLVLCNFLNAVWQTEILKKLWKR